MKVWGTVSDIRTTTLLVDPVISSEGTEREDKIYLLGDR